MSNISLSDKLFDEALRIVLPEHDKKEVNEYKNITIEEGKHKFSSEYQKKKENLLRIVKKSEKISRKSLSFIFRRTAVVVLILLSVSFVSLLTVESVRHEIGNAFMTFFERYIRIEFRNRSAANGNVADIITNIYLPTFIPDGFREYEILKSEANVFALYINRENAIISYTQGLFSATLYVSGEDYTMREIEINGMKGNIIIYTDADGDEITGIIILWNDDRYYFHLSTHLTEYETIRIAESVARMGEN